MMFVYHYVIIPFHPQYLNRKAPLILQGAGSQGAGSGGAEHTTFLYSYHLVPTVSDLLLLRSLKGIVAIGNEHETSTVPYRSLSSRP